MTIAGGPSYSTRGVPTITWGTVGGHLERGASVDIDRTEDAQILDISMASPTNDTTTTPPKNGSAVQYNGMKA